MSKDCNYLYNLIASRVKIDRNGNERRQSKQPVEQDRRSGQDRRDYNYCPAVITIDSESITAYGDKIKIVSGNATITIKGGKVID